jgi:hypothetical protein
MLQIKNSKDSKKGTNEGISEWVRAVDVEHAGRPL